MKNQKLEELEKQGQTKFDAASAAQQPTPTNPPVVNAAQQVETESYVPSYRVKPEFREAVTKAIGEYPFEQIAGIMNAISVDTMDHNTLTQVINVLGKFPYIKIAGILANVNSFVEQIVDED
jgi:hypothetical protein